ncbi:MAG: primosomal protein N' [Deltaproteobacteria bacterium]|nr:primosomal protein N' [Deltaproteobacteria bacterium]
MNSNITSQEQLVLSVAIPRAVNHLFDYKVPDQLVSKIQAGSIVRVPFGKTQTHAFVIEKPKSIKNLEKEYSQIALKEILEVIPEMIIPQDVLKLCQWAEEYYFMPLGEILNTAFPALLLKEKKIKKANKQIIENDNTSKIFELTSEQKLAVDIIEKLRVSQTTEQSQPKVSLLHGVTGSGKTEVYIELARNTLKDGKNVLVLVPEIALTSQLHNRFQSQLKEPVGLWHSAMPDGKKYFQTKELIAGKLRVLIGARSAVFAPIKNLGLIVIDEEHDSSYKQEDRFKYHARDLAIVRAKFTKATVILGSATPSLESQQRVKEKKYTHVFLKHRVAGGTLPKIEIIQLKPENRVQDIQAPLDNKTLQTIRETILKKEQVIIYLNRRGFAACLICQDCGEVPQCKNCSLSLTYHKKQNKLRCHVCGYFVVTPLFCAKCQSINLDLLGAGTESLETELPTLIPEAKILRLDRDQVTSHSRLEKILNQFRNGEANVLLGTQMLVKGHDFPNVTLVTVILADALFRFPDFRAEERARQILTQISGRAGRGELPGKVIIQTYQENHPLFEVLKGNAKETDFLERENLVRKELSYPPFGRMAKLRLTGKNQDAVKRQSEELALFVQNTSKNKQVISLGPSQAYLEKMKGQYRWDLILKTSYIQDLRFVVERSIEFCKTNRWHFSVDIDPYGL